MNNLLLRTYQGLISFEKKTIWCSIASKLTRVLWDDLYCKIKCDRRYTCIFYANVNSAKNLYTMELKIHLRCNYGFSKRKVELFDVFAKKFPTCCWVIYLLIALKILYTFEVPCNVLWRRISNSRNSSSFGPRACSDERSNGGNDHCPETFNSRINNYVY